MSGELRKWIRAVKIGAYPSDTVRIWDGVVLRICLDHFGLDDVDYVVPELSNRVSMCENIDFK